MKSTYLIFFIFLLFINQPFLTSAQPHDTVSFDNLLTLALDNNYGIRLTKNSTEISKLNNTYGNSGFLPIIGISAANNISAIDRESTDFDGTKTTTDNLNTKILDAAIQLNWTLFDGTKMFVTKNRLDELEKKGMIQLQLETENVYVNLASAYYALVQEQKLDEVLKFTLGISKFRLDLAEKKFKLGAASEIDRIQASLDFSNDSSLLLKQETKITNLKAHINQIIGRQPDIEFAATTEMKIINELKYDELENSMTEQNRVLLLAKNSMLIKELELKETRSAFLPELSLYSDYGYLHSQYSKGLTNWNQNLGPTVGLRLGYNIFNGFNDDRKRQIGKIEYQTAQLVLESEMNAIKSEFYQAFNDYSSAKKQIELESENLVNARKNLQFAVELYKQGSIDEIDFREIQRKEFDAESRLLYAQYYAKMAEIQLLQISGDLRF